MKHTAPRRAILATELTQLLPTACGLAASLALTDVLIGSMPAPVELESPGAAVAAVAAAAALFLAVFAVAWGTFRIVPSPLRGESRLLAATLTLLAAVALWLSAPANTYFAYFACQPDVFVCPPYVLKSLAPLLAVAPALFVLLRGASREVSLSRASAGAVVSVPVLLGVALVAHWRIAYGDEPAGTFWRIAAAAVVLIAACALLAAGKWSRLSSTPSWLGVTTLALLLAAPGVWPPVERGIRRAMAPSASPDTPTLVLLVSIDALRADVAQDPEYEAVMPGLRSFMREATVFAQAVTPAPWTGPTVGSWMTGASPVVHQLASASPLSRRFTTLAERMRAAGYTTRAIVGNPQLDRNLHIARGFDDYSLMRPSAGPFPGGLSLTSLSIGARLLERLRAAPSEPATTAHLTDTAVAWIRAHAGERTFLWLHYLDPHSPYAPPAEYLPPGFTGPASADVYNLDSPEARAHAFTLYRAEARYVDDSFEQLLGEIRRLGLYDRSLIIVTSDHGEEFGEHGDVAHSRNVYNTSLSVPLALKPPGAANPRTIRSPVSTQSLMPTILDLSGGTWPDWQVESPSLAPWVRGTETAEPAEPVLSWFLWEERPSVAVYTNGLKYIRTFDPPAEELFDLARDPDERISIAAERPVELAAARRTLAAAQARATRARAYYAPGTPRAVPGDAARRLELKALGYIQ